MPVTQSEIERRKHLVEQARKLRERSAVLQAQSKELQKMVRDQHYEMLSLFETLNDLLPIDGNSPKANR